MGKDGPPGQTGRKGEHGSNGLPGLDGLNGPKVRTGTVGLLAAAAANNVFLPFPRVYRARKVSSARLDGRAHLEKRYVCLFVCLSISQSMCLSVRLFVSRVLACLPV